MSRIATDRKTVDLSGYPDLVVIYLGMRVNAWYGLKRLLRVGPQINSSVAARPDGLLHHEQVFYSLFPLHVGMRQYWRDLASLLAWTRSDPHRQWWKDFLRDSGGTGFWHETYTMRGGMEAILRRCSKAHRIRRLCSTTRCSRHPVQRVAQNGSKRRS